MHKLAIVIISFILLTGCATYRPDQWTKEQVVLQGVATGLKIIDFGQTLDIAKNPNKYKEMNLAIGKHPSTSRVKRYFYISLIAQPVITWLLPDDYRNWWLGTNIVVSGYLVGHNYSIGLRANF